MRQIKGIILNNFAEAAVEAETPREAIIADMNLIVSSCAASLEIGRPELAQAVFEWALARQGAQIEGGIDPKRWRQVARIASANLSVDSTEIDDILADLMYWENPYKNVARTGHPTARKAS